MRVLPGVRLQVLGPARITVNGAPAPSELLWRKHVALLTYLARSPRRARTRDHLVGLLWGERDERSARHSLSEALRVFRRVLGDVRVRADVDQVALAADALVMDCEELEAYCAAGDWAAAAALIQGEFLEGLAVPGANGFESWLAAERLTWRTRSVEALTRHAEGLLDSGDVRAAGREATRALVLEPAAEPAARVAMRALALAGDRAAALAVGGRFVTAVRERLDSEPGAETQHLLARLREARVGLRVPAAPGGAGERAPLVARQAALRRMNAAWTRARVGAGGVVLIEGEPGLGKTRLLDELLDRVRLEPVIVAAARAVPSDARDEWSGMAGLLAGGLEGAPGMAAAPPGAVAALRAPAAAGDWSPARVVTAIAKAVADEHPVLLALDDGQYLDAASADALPQVARDLARRPVLIVACLETGSRLPWADAVRAQIGRSLTGEVIALERLDASALAALARWWLPRYAESDLGRLVRRVERDSAGVPLLATAVLEAVASGFRLSPGAPAWPGERRTLVDTLPGALPPAVLGAVCARFQQLPPAAQEVLGAAAAVAERFTTRVLEKATGLDRRAVEPALDRLEWDRWLVVDARGYAFAAPIVRAILLQEMLTPGQVRRFVAAAGA